MLFGEEIGAQLVVVGDGHAPSHVKLPMAPLLGGSWPNLAFNVEVGVEASRAQQRAESHFAQAVQHSGSYYSMH